MFYSGTALLKITVNISIHSNVYHHFNYITQIQHSISMTYQYQTITLTLRHSIKFEL